MLDVVYICRDGLNEELRYSIRSVVKNLPHSKIWVVGGKPPWYKGNHIRVKQSGTKFENARANMEAIVRNENISDNFILMNDDFYIISPVDEVRYYHAGSLSNKLEYFMSTHPTSTYTTLLNKSMKTLQEMGIHDPLDYALHIPMVMNKQLLSEILPLSISWRLAYGNIYNVDSHYVECPEGYSKDVKVYIKDGKLTDITKSPLSKIYLSSDDNSFQRIRNTLKTQFPKPTQYE